MHCNCEPWTGLFKPTTSEHGGSSSAVDWDCATSRKVAGSVPDIVIGVSHWRNPSCRSVTLGSTQPLTGMSKGIGKCGRCVGLTTWQHSCADYLEILEPQQPGNLRACPGFDLSLPFTLIIYFFHMHFNIISRLPTNLISFKFRVSEGSWNINVNAWGFGTLGYFGLLDYFSKWRAFGMNDDWQLKEKTVITAGCIFAVTCLLGSIICTGAYHFTAAFWCECVSRNVRDKDRLMRQFNIQGPYYSCQCNFSSLYRLPNERCSWNFPSVNLRKFAINVVILDAIGQ
jgi:hypothetical protein